MVSIFVKAFLKTPVLRARGYGCDNIILNLERPLLYSWRNIRMAQGNVFVFGCVGSYLACRCWWLCVYVEEWIYSLRQRFKRTNLFYIWFFIENKHITETLKKLSICVSLNNCFYHWISLSLWITLDCFYIYVDWNGRFNWGFLMVGKSKLYYWLLEFWGVSEFLCHSLKLKKGNMFSRWD